MTKIKNSKNETRLIEWIITNKCNYNCSYCIRNKNYQLGLSDPKQFLKGIKKSIHGSWEFLIMGGEPFVQPNFLKIVQELIDMGHSISIITNLSMPIRQIKSLCEICGKKLVRLVASLHLEEVNPDDFLKKAIEVKKIINPITVFKINSVAKNTNINDLGEIGKRFLKQGIGFELQSFKLPSGAFEKYSPSQKKIISKFGRMFGIKEPNFRGKRCWTGCSYFVLNQTGEAYRCMSALKSKKNYLGNILDGSLKLYKRSKLCEYDLCPCIGPFINGMIELKK